MTLTEMSQFDVVLRSTLLPLLVAVSSLTAFAAFWLFAVKVYGNVRSRFDEFRRASYVGAISEIATRSGYPLDSLRNWAPDPVFVDTLMEFLRFLQGRERDNLLRLSRELGIVERFMATLDHGRRRESRTEAAEALSEIGDPSAVPALLKALNDPVVEVRIQAAEALARLQEPAAVVPLIGLLHREEEWAAARIADSVVRMGSIAVGDLSRHVLLTSIGDPQEAQRIGLAVRALGLIGDPSAEAALLEALESEYLDVRVRAAAALAGAGTPRCVPALIRALRDPAWEVRSQAAKTLGRRLAVEARDPLRDALRDESWWVRINAAAALAEIPGGVEVLVEATVDDDAFARDTARAQLGTLGFDEDTIAELLHVKEAG